MLKKNEGSSKNEIWHSASPDNTGAAHPKARAHEYAVNGGNSMKPIRVISTAVLFLLLGTTLRTYPQQQEQQDKNKEQHAQQQQDKNRQKQQQDQNKQRAQQQDRNKQQQQHVQQQQHAQQQQDKNKQKEKQDQNKQHAQQQDRNKQQQHVQQQQHAQQQGQQKANRPSQQQEQRVVWQQQRAHSWQSEHRTWQQRGGYVGYHIPDDRYRGYFGRNHGFRIFSLPMVVIGGYPRFQYGGYWFSLVDPWPEYWSNNWYENDDVYVDYFDDGYYLYNRRYPRNRIAIRVYLN
jgi:hypothetical protein